MQIELLLIVVCLFCFILENEARGMWGSKRKFTDEDEDDDFNSQTNFELKRKMAASSSASMERRKQSTTTTKPTNNDAILESFETYISLIDQFLSSPQFDSVMSPESMQQIAKQVPGLVGNEQYDEFLRTVDSMSQDELRSQMQAGVQSIRTYFDELVSIASDPDKLNEALLALPEDGRDIVQGLINGDLSPLKDRIINEPTIDRYIKQILISLLDGDIGQAIESGIEFIKTHPDVVESFRQQLLLNPEQSAMAGLPSDVIRDKKKWMATITDGLRMLGQMYATGGGGAEGVDERVVGSDGGSRRRFANA